MKFLKAGSVVPQHDFELRDEPATEGNMEESYARILNDLAGDCSEYHFINEMRCPSCGGDLTIRVHPDGKALFVRCRLDTVHLAMHGEFQSPPEWSRNKITALGWY